MNQEVQSIVAAAEGLTALRRSVAGAVIAPTDAGYDQARRSFNALVDRRPAAIVRCFGPSDVATAFDFARVQGLEVAVRGGGHNPAGHCVLDGGLVIDLSLMRGVDVDSDARIAHSQGGATWLDFDSATQAFGLVTPGGVVGSTGVAGLTFGGGIGHLTAQHGLTCDNLVAAEVVTPDGTVVRAGANEDAELLWGLRGGAETSASRRDWSSACIRSNELSAGGSSTPERASRRRFAASATWSRARPATSAAGRCLRWTTRSSRR